MIKGLFVNTIFKENINDFWLSGVGKKVKTQCNVLSEYFELSHMIVNSYVSNLTLWHKIKIRLPYTAVGVNWKYDSKFDGWDFIYFRKAEIDYTVFRLFKNIKRNNPNCKLIFEIPTYPYDKEIINNLKDYIFLWKDRKYRKKLYKCVDRIVTFSEDDQIWGIRTIRVFNGFDFNGTRIRKVRKDDGTINLISVASFAKWHGCDRILEGMGIYYKNGGKRNVVLHLVGEGDVFKEYREIINKYGIHKHCVFHGWKSGEELDDIFDKMDICVDILGGHRKNYLISSSLKSREAAAKGIPIITECIIDFLPDDYQYQLRVPWDESPINIEIIINFFDNLYINENPKIVAKKIREFGCQRCDMHVTMQPIVDYIQNNTAGH